MCQVRQSAGAAALAIGPASRWNRKGDGDALRHCHANQVARAGHAGAAAESEQHVPRIRSAGFMHSLHHAGGRLTRAWRRPGLYRKCRCRAAGHCGMSAATLCTPRVNQATRRFIQRIKRNCPCLIENHQRIHGGERIDLPRQRALFTQRRTGRTPEIDRIFQLGQGNFHAPIVRLRRPGGAPQPAFPDRIWRACRPVY
jgi:hypothetical protein